MKKSELRMRPVDDPKTAKETMRIQQATKLYEAWLLTHTPLLKPDLALKHQRMKDDVFSFLRATFYRWMQVWPEVCPDLVSAPEVLAVGDLHVENFGTWRDSEGRLVWGINDFDEAYPLPFTNDLVRLAASAKFAGERGYLAMKPKDAYDAVLAGYTDGLESGGQPFVLAEQHGWLRRIAESNLRDPVAFWKKMLSLPAVQGRVPASAVRSIDALMPERGLSYKIHRRVAGLGSLGRQRLVAVANWHGGKVAREAKALAPSACIWARDNDGSGTVRYQALLDTAVRCRDPFVKVHEPWIVRRLSPHCSRIELTSLPKERDESRLLHAMGWETANVHLGSRNVKAIRRHLARCQAGWLRAATDAMVKQTMRDWKEWKGA